MAEGWVKLHRKFLNWEWFECSDTSKLFLYCLLKVNHEQKNWRGHTIKKGQFITSLNSLKKETGLSFQTIRTCLKRLEATGELTKESTKSMTILTICNFDTYNNGDDSANTVINTELTQSQHRANNNEESKELKEKDNNINSAITDMCADANNNIKPTAGKCLKLFMETYLKIKSFNPRAEFRNIQHALFEAVALDGEAKVMQSLEDYVYYSNRCNQREYTKSPVKWLEEYQYKTDWLQMVDASNKGKNNSSDWDAFNARDQKYPEMKWEN